MSDLYDIGAADEVPLLGARTARVGGKSLAVFRTSQDRYFALDDRCPHRGGPLSQGLVHGARVTCPLHNFVIDLESGEAVAPDRGCVRRYEIKVEAGRLRLRLPARNPAAA